MIRYATRTFGRDLRSAARPLAALALCLSFLFVALGLGVFIRQLLVVSLTSEYHEADVVIFSTDTPESLAHTVTAISHQPGVAAVSLERRVRTRVRGTQAAVSINLVSLPSQSLSATPVPFLNSRDIILYRQDADILGVDAGQWIHIAPGGLQLHVVAVVESGFASHGTAAMSPAGITFVTSWLADQQPLHPAIPGSTNEISTILVKASPGVTASELRATLLAAGIESSTREDLSFIRSLDLSISPGVVRGVSIGYVVLAIGLMLMTTTPFQSHLTQWMTRHVAQLRALGASPRDARACAGTLAWWSSLTVTAAGLTGGVILLGLVWQFMPRGVMGFLSALALPALGTLAAGAVMMLAAVLPLITRTASLLPSEIAVTRKVGQMRSLAWARNEKIISPTRRAVYVGIRLVVIAALLGGVAICQHLASTENHSETRLHLFELSFLFGAVALVVSVPLVMRVWLWLTGWVAIVPRLTGRPTLARVFRAGTPEHVRGMGALAVAGSFMIAGLLVATSSIISLGHSEGKTAEFYDIRVTTQSLDEGDAFGSTLDHVTPLTKDQINAAASIPSLTIVARLATAPITMEGYPGEPVQVAIIDHEHPPAPVLTHNGVYVMYVPPSFFYSHNFADGELLRLRLRGAPIDREHMLVQPVAANVSIPTLLSPVLDGRLTFGPTYGLWVSRSSGTQLRIGQEVALLTIALQKAPGTTPMIQPARPTVETSTFITPVAGAVRVLIVCGLAVYTAIVGFAFVAMLRDRARTRTVLWRQGLPRRRVIAGFGWTAWLAVVPCLALGALLGVATSTQLLVTAVPVIRTVNHAHVSLPLWAMTIAVTALATAIGIALAGISSLIGASLAEKKE